MTNKEILNVFALYLGKTCIIFDDIEDQTRGVAGTIEGIDYVNEEVIVDRSRFDPQCVKLHLQPLNAITIYDCAKLASEVFNEDIKSYTIDNYYMNMTLKYSDNGFRINFPNLDKESIFMSSMDITQYINALYIFLRNKGYDLPYWFGEDREENNKTLIELGIAINLSNNG